MSRVSAETLISTAAGEGAVALLEEFDEDAVGGTWVDPYVVGAGGGVCVFGDSGDAATLGADVFHGIYKIVEFEGNQVDAFAAGLEKLADMAVVAEGFKEFYERPLPIAEEGVAVAELGVVVGRLHDLKVVEAAEPVGGLLKVVYGDTYEAQVGRHSISSRVGSRRNYGVV